MPYNKLELSSQNGDYGEHCPLGRWAVLLGASNRRYKVLTACALMMEASSISEKSADVDQTTQCIIPADSHLLLSQPFSTVSEVGFVHNEKDLYCQ
jgi:hypothetical protein